MLNPLPDLGIYLVLIQGVEWDPPPPPIDGVEWDPPPPKGSKHITPKNARQNDFSLKKMPDNLPFFEITRILYKM